MQAKEVLLRWFCCAGRMTGAHLFIQLHQKTFSKSPAQTALAISGKIGIQLLSVSTVCNQFTIASCKIGKHVGYEVSA